MPSKTEQLFEAEAELRRAARYYAETCDKMKSTSSTANESRSALRAAAKAYAAIAVEIDDCFGEGD